MANFEPLSLETADDEGRELLEQVQSNYGFIPNLLGNMAQILEVVLGVAMKTISNYTNHIAGTELDAAFADFAWKAPQS